MATTNERAVVAWLMGLSALLGAVLVILAIAPSTDGPPVAAAARFIAGLHGAPEAAAEIERVLRKALATERKRRQRGKAGRDEGSGQFVSRDPSRDPSRVTSVTRHASGHAVPSPSPSPSSTPTPLSLSLSGGGDGLVGGGGQTHDTHDGATRGDVTTARQAARVRPTKKGARAGAGGRDLAEAVLADFNAARLAAIPNARPFAATDSNLKNIRARLDAAAKPAQTALAI